MEVKENRLRKIIPIADYQNINYKKRLLLYITYYAFCSIFDPDEIETELYIYDKDLRFKEKVHLDTCGITPYNAMLFNDTLYFTSSKTPYDMPTHMMGKMDIKTRTITPIKLDQRDPLSLLAYKDKIYISHYHLVHDRGGGLTVYDPNTGKQEYHHLGHAMEQMTLYKDKLYVLGYWEVYIYDADTLTLIDKMEPSPMDNRHSYLTGIFAIE